MALGFSTSACVVARGNQGCDVYRIRSIEPILKKTRTIQEMAPPENVTELRRFCGMTNYLAKYMPNHAIIMEPLHQLNSSETAWQWTHEHQTAFKHVKEALTSSPTLAYFDSKRAVKLRRDASQFGLSAALLQDDRPVAYSSRSLTTTE